MSGTTGIVLKTRMSSACAMVMKITSIKAVGVVSGFSVAFRITLNLLMTFWGLVLRVHNSLNLKDVCRMQASGIWNGI